MSPVAHFAIELIDQTWVEETPGAEWEAAMWIADSDVELSAKIALRNADIAQRLVASIPGLSSEKASFEPYDYEGEGLSQEAVLRRYHRSRMLSCPWRGGVLEIRIFDRAMDVAFQMVDLARAELPSFMSDLRILLARIEQIGGMKPWHAKAYRVEDVDAAMSRLLETRKPVLERYFRAVRRERAMQWLAWPGLFLTGLLAFALSFGIAAEALRQGESLSGVQESITKTFITDGMPAPRYQLGVFPKFSLLGRIEGQTQQQVLPVFRDEFLRAGPGALFTVMPTGDTKQPYMLRAEYEASLPLIRLGGLTLPWQVILGLLPVGFWFFYFIRPLINTMPEQRAVTMRAIGGRAGMVLLGGMALIAVLLLRRFL